MVATDYQQSGGNEINITRPFGSDPSERSPWSYFQPRNRYNLFRIARARFQSVWQLPARVCFKVIIDSNKREIFPKEVGKTGHLLRCIRSAPDSSVHDYFRPVIKLSETRCGGDSTFFVCDVIVVTLRCAFQLSHKGKNLVFCLRRLIRFVFTVRKHNIYCNDVNYYMFRLR